MKTVKSFYNIFIVNVSKLNSNAVINNENKRVIGINNDGINVYSYIGKYGPVIQIGDKDVKYIKLDAKYSVDSVTIKDYEEITKFPKSLGKHKNIDVLIKNEKAYTYVWFLYIL